MSAQGFRTMLPVVVMVTAACGGSTDVGIAQADGAAPFRESGARSMGGASGAGGRAGGSATGGGPGSGGHGNVGSHDAGSGGVTDASTGISGAGGAAADSAVLGAGGRGGAADGGTAGIGPTDGGAGLIPDANLDALIPEPTCSPVTAVFSAGLAGPWDCAIDPACVPAPPHDAGTTCRESPEPGVFVYRSRACWERWHPGLAATVDFSREIVATVCTWRDNMEQLVFEGVAGCGAEATVKARTVGTCSQEGTIDCPYTSFGVALPATVRLVHSSIAETQLPPVVQLDSGLQCISIEPSACGDPSNPFNDACWRGCGSDADCTLVETNTCGCEGDGQRVAIRNQLATQWQVTSTPCALTDGSRCHDCAAGYAGARAACVQGLCTVACQPADASPDPCAGISTHPGMECDQTTSCACCEYGYLCSSGYCECGASAVCQSEGCLEGGIPVPEIDAGVPVGNACSSDADCGSGWCETGWAGGYCTEFCTAPGSQDTCPEGSVCGLQCAGPGAPRCLQRCVASGGCRNDNFFCMAESTITFDVCLPRPCDYPEDCQDGAVCTYRDLCGELTCTPP